MGLNPPLLLASPAGAPLAGPGGRAASLAVPALGGGLLCAAPVSCGPAQFALTPREDGGDSGDPRDDETFAIEAEFADLVNVQVPDGTATGGAGMFQLTPRRGSKSRQVHRIEVELASLSAFELMREFGPGRIEAEAAWKACVLREKVRIARAIAVRRFQPPQDESAAQIAAAEADEEEADTELMPTALAELGGAEALRPLASDPVFNFAALEKAEQECELLLIRVFGAWLGATAASAAAATTGPTPVSEPADRAKAAGAGA